MKAELHQQRNISGIIRHTGILLAGIHCLEWHLARVFYLLIDGFWRYFRRCPKGSAFGCSKSCRTI